MAAIILFSLFSTEPDTNMKIPSETENQLLLSIAPALKSNFHKNGISGQSPRYSRIKTLLEVEIVICCSMATLLIRCTKNFAVSHFLPNKVNNYVFTIIIIFSSPSYYVWGTLIIVQIFVFRFFADLHVLESAESKKLKISMVSRCLFVN